LKQEPDERPKIFEINETLGSIDSENNNVFTVPGNEEKRTKHSCQID
jgi:hypothetical protein